MTAPPRLEGNRSIRCSSIQIESDDESDDPFASPPSAQPPSRNKPPTTSTTMIGIERGAGSARDPYEAGTARERAYMRSVKYGKLGSANTKELDSDDEEFIDIDAVQEEEEFPAGEGFVEITSEVVGDLDTQEISQSNYDWELY